MSISTYLSIQNVQKTYGASVALKPTWVDIARGEFFSLIGPSGSGKTTLLGSIAGFTPPTAGAIYLDGIDIVALAPHRRHIGMVFQNYSLFPHMTVAENVGFPLRMRGEKASEIRKKVGEFLSIVRLSDKGDRKPSELSGGQQQRVALARAAVFNPALLLMDEPLGALDKNLRTEMQFEIKRFQQAIGATVVYVTHDQEEAAAMSHRIGIMNQGEIVQVGTSQQLYEQPKNEFVAGFLGEANLIPAARVAMNGSAGPASEASGTLVAEGRQLKASDLVCVRPEAIQIDHAPPSGRECFEGRVLDAVYGTGTMRYLVQVDGMPNLVVRTPCIHGEPPIPPDSPAFVSWDRNDMRLIGRGEEP